MKTAATILFLLFTFHPFVTKAQDTLATNTFKYKLGAKFIAERSGDYSLTPQNFRVYSGGFQLVRKIKNSRSSIETGIYMISKAVAYYNDTSYWRGLNRALFRNISVPLHYRFDTKVVYVSAGPFIDYLVIEDYSHSDYKNEYSRKLNLGASINLGIEKSINKQLSLLVEGRYAVTLTNPDTGRCFYGPSYVNYGIAVGLNYKMRRRSWK